MVIGANGREKGNQKKEKKRKKRRTEKIRGEKGEDHVEARPERERSVASRAETMTRARRRRAGAADLDGPIA